MIFLMNHKFLIQQSVRIFFIHNKENDRKFGCDTINGAVMLGELIAYYFPHMEKKKYQFSHT